jgi:hypothetical protein
MLTTGSTFNSSGRSRGRIIEFGGPSSVAAYTTAVSLHAHTNRSREVMTAVAPYIDRIPIVAALARREMRAYERRNGCPIDFGKGWWQPPVRPEDVLASERTQIAALGLRPLVSITDHDTIDAGLSLASRWPNAAVPVSFEWTVPIARGFLHLGVHNLPPESSADIFRTLIAFTRGSSDASLGDLLDLLVALPQTLLVLNHPLWDLAAIGSGDHIALVRSFLSQYRGRIHALELNGYRSCHENSGVVALAGAYGLPLISGGDRHGCAVNSLLNLTTATSFGEFAREVRDGRRSTVLVMPAYREALVDRKLAVASDAVRDYPSHPHGQRRWFDRVWYERDGVVRSLSDVWRNGGPFWVRSAVGLFDVATRTPLLPALRVFVWLAGASLSGRVPPPPESIEFTG